MKIEQSGKTTRMAIVHHLPQVLLLTRVKMTWMKIIGFDFVAHLIARPGNLTSMDNEYT